MTLGTVYIVCNSNEKNPLKRCYYYGMAALPVQESEPFGRCRKSAPPSVQPRRCNAASDKQKQKQKVRGERAGLGRTGANGKVKGQHWIQWLNACGCVVPAIEAHCFTAQLCNTG